MTGFTILIYFKDTFDNPDLQKLKTLLPTSQLTDWKQDGADFTCDLDLTKYANKFSVRLYSGTEDDFDQDQKKEFQRAIDYIPKYYIGLMGWKNLKEIEVFITDLALDIIKIKEGMVDLSAALDAKFLPDISGKVKKFVYNDANKLQQFTHIVDKEFLSNWTKHKDFHIPV